MIDAPCGDGWALGEPLWERRNTFVASDRPGRNIVITHALWRLPFCAVIAAALLIGIAGCGAASRDQPAAAGFVGYHWQITNVRHDGNDVPIVARPGGYVMFTTDRNMFADDSVNFYSGRFQLSKSGFRPELVAVTAAGYVGDDASVLALIAAAQAVMQPNATVIATVRNDELTLTAAGYDITCRKAGTAKAPGSVQGAVPTCHDQSTC